MIAIQNDYDNLELANESSFGEQPDQITIAILERAYHDGGKMGKHKNKSILSKQVGDDDFAEEPFSSGDSLQGPLPVYTTHATAEWHSSLRRKNGTQRESRIKLVYHVVSGIPWMVVPSPLNLAALWAFLRSLIGGTHSS